MPDADESNSMASTPVELSSKPDVIDGRRVLGVVPGKPVAGERKEPDDDEMVMVWPHLLVRHALAALVVMGRFVVHADRLDNHFGDSLPAQDFNRLVGMDRQVLRRGLGVQVVQQPGQPPQLLIFSKMAGQSAHYRFTGQAVLDHVRVGQMLSEQFHRSGTVNSIGHIRCSSVDSGS